MAYDLTPDAEGLSKAVATMTLESGGVLRFRFFPNDAPNTVARITQLISEGYYDGIKFHLGEKLSGQGVAEAHDLPRFAGRALIGDPRNDENSIVSQLQGLFHRFHNRMVDDNPELSLDQVQERVRRPAGESRSGAPQRSGAVP